MSANPFVVGQTAYARLRWTTGEYAREMEEWLEDGAAYKVLNVADNAIQVIDKKKNAHLMHHTWFVAQQRNLNACVAAYEAGLNGQPCDSLNHDEIVCWRQGQQEAWDRREFLLERKVKQ